ncbi:MAG: response regulator [Cyanomargarita calcarea GSE-NOS-MK-12-04C]|jgi:PAS domain S-box-containing protein|uniref:histidine kinase n=1 Tax=Cyanomargarita calcarea GSE-NOS-MK-12-04C TaxID=2839659 RepID=A0A951QT15_9CYAN|nr:response regulator [Cyanomargarita calcarea GSE-NOS-MK-12-04C]
MSANTASKGIILVVDDTQINLEVLFALLDDSGFKVLIAENGESAIQKANYALPDLILLDILMPGIDGFETCRRLKQNEATKAIPVIFLTAMADTVDKVKGFNLGAVDYITKPIHPEEVLARVETHLKLQTLTKQLQQQNARLEQEIQERKQAEQQIREQAALLNVATDAIFLSDLDHRVLFWNQGAERVYGWRRAEILGKNITELVYEESPQLEEALKLIVVNGEWQGELHQLTKSNQKIIVQSRWTLVRDEAGQPKSILTVDTDITDKKQLEAQFFRVQRLESLGTIASGIAHDFNNILTPILAAAQLLPLRLTDIDDSSKLLLQILEDSSKRGAELVKQILSFARGGESNRTTLQLRHLLKEVVQFVKSTFPKSIEISIDISTPNLWTVWADATQLHQVLMNLVVNARDAMPFGGTLSLCASNLYIDETYAQMTLEAQVGSYVLITVTDTGTGIHPEIIDRIFDPFFTTKEVGKGTGLGLSTALGIIKNHGGFVKVYSEVGKGTQFQVYLPAQAETPTLQVAKDLTMLTGSGELILVVDDDSAVQIITKASLEDYNYRTLIANDGIEAIAYYAKRKNEISAVLMDIQMPSMNGLIAIQTLKKLNPSIKIIATSGLTSNNQLASEIGVDTFLSKPYTINQLLNILHSILSTK